MKRNRIWENFSEIKMILLPEKGKEEGSWVENEVGQTEAEKGLTVAEGRGRGRFGCLELWSLADCYL